MPGLLRNWMAGAVLASMFGLMGLGLAGGCLAQDTTPLQPAPSTDASSEPATDPATGEDQMSIGEVPNVETMELTPDIAKRAIDAYMVVHDKYKDADIENYENLQDFVDQTDDGKKFEADVKGFGFANVNDWNLAITTETLVYGNISEDQTDDIKQQIEDVKADTELAQDMKDRMVKSLQAMIPSENNKKIIDDLLNDPAYSDKIKSLDISEE
jgi:hypothetical protein